VQNSAIAKKVIKHIAATGCDDVLGKPFFPGRLDEALAVDPDWSDFLLGQIGAALTQNPVSIGPLCQIAIPKGRYTFRTVSYMSLVDTLKFTSVAFSIGREIEGNRLPRNIIYSNRLNTKTLTLDRSNYDGFRQASKVLSESRRYSVKIVTDIANFYDRINLHKLENILTEIGCDRTAVGKLNRMLIQWSKQNSFGIPVGSDASRLLAEAMLINADRELSSNRIKFIRYVDDYRIFCTSQERAYEAMQILDAALRREGLFLNSGKTKLIDLNRSTDEHRETAPEFDTIDLKEKIEKQVVIRTRYASKIAKYYHFPGLEAAKKFREQSLTDLLLEIENPDTTEDRLKYFVKAAIYADAPEFSWLDKATDLYPHLIPYTVDAIVKEHARDNSRIDSNFSRQAVSKFRTIFRRYERNDYFRIQACRLLCHMDKGAGSFLSKELAKLNAGHEALFSQIIGFLGNSIPRPDFLDFLARYNSYGPFARASLAFAVKNGAILSKDEQRAQIKHLQGVEVDPFLRQLLR
jgi:hypothetical protein